MPNAQCPMPNAQCPMPNAQKLNLLRLSVRRLLGKVQKRGDRVNYKKLVSQPCGNLPTAAPAMPATDAILLTRSYSTPQPSHTRTVLVSAKTDSSRSRFASPKRLKNSAIRCAFAVLRTCVWMSPARKLSTKCDRSHVGVSFCS